MLVGVEFNAPLDTIQVISEAVFTVYHLTDTDNFKSGMKERVGDGKLIIISITVLDKLS